MDLGHWVNDGLMALFFFVIGLEVRYELSVGSLNDRRRIMIPGLAGIGGMLVPVALYLLIAPGPEAADGWGIVIGTDTAFLLGALAVVGPRFVTQLRIFLLAITVIDDIVAVTVIGVVYSGSIQVPELVVALVLGAVLSSLSRFDVWRAVPYVLTVLVMWYLTLNAGLHASIARHARRSAHPRPRAVPRGRRAGDAAVPRVPSVAPGGRGADRAQGPPEGRLGQRAAPDVSAPLVQLCRRTAVRPGQRGRRPARRRADRRAGIGSDLGRGGRPCRGQADRHLGRRAVRYPARSVWASCPAGWARAMCWAARPCRASGSPCPC